MRNSSFELYEKFQELLQWKYNPSTIALLEDFIFLVFNNQLLPTSTLQRMNDRIKETRGNNERPILKSPKAYHTPNLPEAWLHAASDTLEKDFRYFKNFTTTCIHDTKSLMTIKPPRWFNDEVLSQYLHLLEISCSNVHITNSQALNCDYSNTRRFINRDNYLKLLTDIAIIPINKDEEHWTFACIWLKTEAELFIEYYDSNEKRKLTYELLPSILRKWITWTFPKNVELEVQCKSPQQRNGYDCGVFLLMGARMRAMGWPVFSQQEADEIIPDARHRIFAEIVAGHLNPTTEYLEIYRSKLSGETAFPSPPSQHGANYVEEKDSAGNIFINLDANSATKEILNFHTPKHESIEINDEEHLIKEFSPLRRNSIEEGAKRAKMKNLKQLESNVAKFTNETRRCKVPDQHECTSPMSTMEEIGQFEEAFNISNFLTAIDEEDEIADPELYEYDSTKLNFFEKSEYQKNTGISKDSQNDGRSEPELKPTPELQHGNEAQSAKDASEIATVSCKVTEPTPENLSPKRALSAASAKHVTNQNDEGDVDTRKKRRKTGNSANSKSAQLAAVNFGSQAVLAENLRAAIIAYRARLQEQSEDASLASLWSDIRPNEHNFQSVLQRNTRLKFARRWSRTQEQLSSHKRDRIAGMKRALGLIGLPREQEKEFNAAKTHANRCSFWLELVDELPFRRDVCRGVAVCACGESTSELERMTRSQREQYFGAIRSRIENESNSIMEDIQAAGSLYEALIDNRLPKHQLALEGNWKLGDMIFEKLVSLDCVPDRIPIPLL